jgi:poly-gamma-glutamate synthesis protein (capsule biosynthesis protein)
MAGYWSTHGSETAGVPEVWVAVAWNDGVNFLPDLSTKSVDAIARHVVQNDRGGDIVVKLLH